MPTILHVIDTTGPGGAESIFIELADRMRERGFRCIPVIRGPGWVCEQLQARGLEPAVLQAKGSMNLAYLRALLRLIRTERVDLIQSHLLGSNVYCALAGWLARIPVVGTFHGMVDVSPNERLRSLKRLVMALGIDTCVVVSSSLRDAIRDAGLLREANTRIIYNGIDTARYQVPQHSVFRAQLGLPEDAVLAVSVGNIRPAKGYDVLIRAAALLAPAHPRLHFLIAGHEKKDLKAELDALSVSLGMQDRVHFLGFVRDTPALLSEADLFLLSSSSEGFSLSTVEALAAGVPSVLTRCGGPEEIAVHGEYALLVAPADADALSRGINGVLSDQGFARRLAAQGQQMVQQRFSISAMLDAYEAAYRELVPSR
ncbi:MAG: glycosyltransferase family 4 protein [Gammaproteobacteria bacterium]